MYAFAKDDKNHKLEHILSLYAFLLATKMAVAVKQRKAYSAISQRDDAYNKHFALAFAFRF